MGVNNMIVKRGDMFYADLSPVVGSEQRGDKTCTYSSERCGKPIQSYRYSCGNHKSAVKGKSAHTHSAQCRFFGTCQRQRCFA